MLSNSIPTSPLRRSSRRRNLSTVPIKVMGVCSCPSNVFNIDPDASIEKHKRSEQVCGMQEFCTHPQNSCGQWVGRFHLDPEDDYAVEREQEMYEMQQLNGDLLGYIFDDSDNSNDERRQTESTAVRIGNTCSQEALRENNTVYSDVLSSIHPGVHSAPHHASSFVSPLVLNRRITHLPIDHHQQPKHQVVILDDSDDDEEEEQSESDSGLFSPEHRPLMSPETSSSGVPRLFSELNIDVGTIEDNSESTISDFDLFSPDHHRLLSQHYEQSSVHKLTSTFVEPETRMMINDHSLFAPQGAQDTFEPQVVTVIEVMGRQSRMNEAVKKTRIHRHITDNEPMTPMTPTTPMTPITPVAIPFDIGDVLQENVGITESGEDYNETEYKSCRNRRGTPYPVKRRLPPQAPAPATASATATTPGSSSMTTTVQTTSSTQQDIQGHRELAPIRVILTRQTGGKRVFRGGGGLFAPYQPSNPYVSQTTQASLESIIPRQPQG